MTTLAADDPDALMQAIALLDAGELVVVPTGASYALACDALHEDALARLFRAKQRGADQAIPLALGGFEEISQVAFPTPLARELAESFWPGDVALVLRARPFLPQALTGNGETVALRCPTHPFPRELARRFGPLALTSARRPGGAAALTLREAREAVGSDARLFLDGGAGKLAPLTVVDASGDAANVLREGHVGAAEVEGHGFRRR